MCSNEKNKRPEQRLGANGISTESLLAEHQHVAEIISHDCTLNHFIGL